MVLRGGLWKSSGFQGEGVAEFRFLHLDLIAQTFFYNPAQSYHFAYLFVHEQTPGAESLRNLFFEWLLQFLSCFAPFFMFKSPSKWHIQIQHAKLHRMVCLLTRSDDFYFFDHIHRLWKEGWILRKHQKMKVVRWSWKTHHSTQFCMLNLNMPFTRRFHHSFTWKTRKLPKPPLKTTLKKMTKFFPSNIFVCPELVFRMVKTAGR